MRGKSKEERTDGGIGGGIYKFNVREIAVWLVSIDSDSWYR